MMRSSAMTILLWLTAMLGNPAAARAQTYWVSSVTTTDLGRVAAAASGTTTFRIDADTGVVTKLSGAGARITTANAYTIAVLNCGAQNACNTANAWVSIASGGTPINRAITLQNFTVSTGSATLLSSPSPGSPITFDIGPIGRSSNKTISIGFDFGVKGDNSGSPSGLSSAQFEVIVSRPNGSNGGALFSTAQAFVSRSLSVTKTADLAFGRIARPSSGSGTVQLQKIRSSGTPINVPNAALSASNAVFNVEGDGYYVWYRADTGTGCGCE